MSVSIETLSKTYGAVRAIDSLSVTFRPGAISVLLGASGCGKTTTLRCIAGLEQPDSGEIAFDGDVVYSSARRIDVPPEKRNLGMVFQSYAIWPHLTVLENVALPLRAHGLPGAEVVRRARETLATVGLTEQSERSAMKLSGGQQQRVSIARCLAANPRLILMDEPLSNLDAKLRVEMRQEIRRLQRHIGATILFVTHDQEEAMSLADEIFLFNLGKMVQRGAPEELYFRPAVRYVAEFLGKANLFPVTVKSDGGGVSIVAKSSGTVVAKGPLGTPYREGEALCMVRPEAWKVGPAGGDGVSARVQETMFVGDRRELHVDTTIGMQTVVTRGFERFTEGDALTLRVEPAHLHLIQEAGRTESDRFEVPQMEERRQ